MQGIQSRDLLCKILFTTFGFCESRLFWLIFSQSKKKHSPMFSLFFTVRNSSCGQVMFLHLSVILLTGGCWADPHLGRHVIFSFFG